MFVVYRLPAQGELLQKPMANTHGTRSIWTPDEYSGDQRRRHSKDKPWPKLPYISEKKSSMVAWEQGWVLKTQSRTSPQYHLLITIHCLTNSSKCHRLAQSASAGTEGKQNCGGWVYLYDEPLTPENFSLTRDEVTAGLSLLGDPPKPLDNREAHDHGGDRPWAVMFQDILDTPKRNVSIPH